MKKIHSATVESHDQHETLTKNDCEIITRKIFLSFVKKNNSLSFFLVSETKRKMELESLFQLALLIESRAFRILIFDPYRSTIFKLFANKIYLIFSFLTISFSIDLLVYDHFPCMKFIQQR